MGLPTGEIGFSVGLAKPRTFWYHEKRFRCSVYGGDIMTSRLKSSFSWLLGKLKERYELDGSARLGHGSPDDKEAKVLNLLILWTDASMECEEYPRQIGK